MEPFVERMFSELLRESGDVLREVEHRDVLLRRRDGSDVMLVDARREEGLRNSLGLAVNVLAALLDEVDVAAVADKILAAVPWITFLDDEGKAEFLREFIATARGCNDLDSYEPLAQLLREWRSTAAIYADPQLFAVLTSPSKSSRRIVKRP